LPAIALSGIGIPIALSFLLMPIGGYSKLEAFASGAALSSTSLGTTFVVLKAVSGSEGPVGALEETLLGTVLGQFNS
jgi:Kef-type K+ transport system membrane component KefB